MKKLIFCEGKDEENFFRSIIKHLDLDAGHFRIKSGTGTSSYSAKFSSFLKSKEGDDVGSVLLTCDSDGNLSGAVEKLSNMIKHNFNVDPTAHSLVAKNGNKYGIHVFDCMLEDVCLQSIKESQKFSLSNEFINKAKHELPDEDFPNNENKARCKSFLSLSVEDVYSLGIAACKGIWDFESDAFDDIKRKLIDISSRD